MRALVIGGGASAWDDLRALGEWDGIVICVNDMIVTYPHDIDHVATLHPEKLDCWCREREMRGGNSDFVSWTRPRKQEMAHRVLPGWNGGSSGFFAVGVALDGLGCDEVVLCGVPMSPTSHFFDDVPWKHAIGHRKAWERKANKLRGRVSSLSGWTREFLGAPPWLESKRGAA